MGQHATRTEPEELLLDEAGQAGPVAAVRAFAEEGLEGGARAPPPPPPPARPRPGGVPGAPPRSRSPRSRSNRIVGEASMMR